MAHGKLTVEYRDGLPDPEGTPVKLGPYYKLQGREEGNHFTGRVPASQAEIVQKQIDNLAEFRSLCEEVVTEAVVLGKKERDDLVGEKKTSPKPAAKNDSRKPNAS